MSSFHVVYELSLKKSIHLCDGFQFKNHLAFYNKISNVIAIKYLAMICYRQMFLSFIHDAHLCEFNAKSLLIYFLKETTSKTIVNIVTCS